MDGKKGGMAIVLGLGKPKPGAEDEELDSSSKEDAAQALIDAVHSKDATGVSDAFDTLMRLCRPGDYEEGSEESG